MKKKPILYKIIGLAVLILPTLIYLIFLIPCLKEEYNILMASGGVIGGAGYYGATKITDKVKYSGLYKTACNTFTTLTLITLTEKFIMQIIFLVATFVISFIIYKILNYIYIEKKGELRDAKLATKITSSIVKDTE